MVITVSLNSSHQRIQMSSRGKLPSLCSKAEVSRELCIEQSKIWSSKMKTQVEFHKVKLNLSQYSYWDSCENAALGGGSGGWGLALKFLLGREATTPWDFIIMM